MWDGKNNLIFSSSLTRVISEKKVKDEKNRKLLYYSCLPAYLAVTLNFYY
jgi:hypothetical protein